MAEGTLIHRGTTGKTFRFVDPSAHCRTTLGEITTVVAGSTPSTTVSNYWDGDIVWVTPADMGKLQSSVIRDSGRRITESGFDAAGLELVPANSVVLSTRAPIGHLALAGIPLCTNQGCKAFVPSPSILGQYLYYALQVAVPRLKALGTGTTFMEVSKADLEDFVIPFPPLPIQRRIAGILDKADRLRRMRRYALELSDQFLPALFLRMFGDPTRNPKGWPERPLRRLCTKFSEGPFGSDLKTSHYRSDGVRVVRLQNIGVGEFLDADKVYISNEHFSELKRHECTTGDVLIGTLGDPNLRACLLPAEIGTALNKADCEQARVNPTETTAEYVCWFLNMPQSLQIVPGLVHGQTRSRISSGQMAALPVPTPPLSLQKSFSRMVCEYEQLRDSHREVLRQAEHLFQSLLNRYFGKEN